MYEYQPIIKEEDFTDPVESSENPQRMTVDLARSFQDRAATNQLDITFCSVEKLWMDTPGKKGPEDKAVMFPHSPIPNDAPNRWHFAPRVETTKIGWELKGRAATGGDALANPITLKLELFTRSEKQPLWTKTMKWKAGECPKRGATEFNGLLGADSFKSAVGKTAPTADVRIVFPAAAKFPDGVLTVDHSPYKLKLSIVDGGEPRRLAAKWIYLDVLVDSLEMNWGDAAMLPPVRNDITDAKNLEKILGHKKDPLNVADKDVKGYEEIILDELKAAHPKPIKNVVHEVKLDSNLFAFQQKQQDHTESFDTHADFAAYKALWGNGARIPLTVKAYIKKSVAGEKTDQVPEALGKSKILWDWNEKKADRWKEPLSAGQAPKTEAFLDAGYRYSNDAKPSALSNCPKQFGGKRGDDAAAANVFPAQAAGANFPNAVRDCAVRKWSALSGFGAGDQRAESAAIFQPSRMAGDAYLVKAYLHFDRDADSEADIQAPPPIQTDDYLFKVFRRIQLNSLVRGRAKLHTDPNALETDLKADYLKELDVAVTVKQTDVDNNVYKAALVEAIKKVSRREHFVDEVQNIPYLSLLAKYAVETDPAADSAAIVFRPWNDIETELEDRFETSSVRVVENLSNAAAFLDENITGAASGTTGILWKAGLRHFVLYPAGTSFSLGEQVRGEVSNAVGQMSLTQYAKSCWGHQFDLTPQTERDDKIYKDSVKVVFPNAEEIVVKYKKLGIKQGFELSPELTAEAKNDLFAAFYRAWRAHDEANSFDVRIHARDDSANARLRVQNLKNHLEKFFGKDDVLDRQTVWTALKNELKKAFIGRDGKNVQKMLSLLLIGEVIWEYAARQLPDEEGIFLLHTPGRYEGEIFPDATSAAVAAAVRMPKVQGAVYPELTGDGNGVPFASRARAVAFLASVPDAASDGIPTKTLRSIFKHELAHALFLPHSPFRTDAGKITPQPKPQCHVKEDKCLMNYDLDTEHFCGLCMMRIRGWDWKAEQLDNRVVAAQILDGDDDTYLTANGVQSVNLPVADKWVDGVHVASKHRLGRKLKVRIEFQQELARANVYVRLLAHKDNAVYTATEKGRKAVFNFARQPAAKAFGDFNQDQGALVTGVTDHNGNFFAEFELPPSVGDRYKIAAWDDDDNRVQSVEITTWRTLYYAIVRYAHPNSVDTNQIKNAIDNTFRHNFTNWVFAGEAADPNNRSFVSDSPAHQQITTLVRNATQGACPNLPAVQYQDLDPFLSRIVLIDMCMKPRAITTTPVTVPVGTGSPAARVEIRNQPNVVTAGVLFDLRKGLYHQQGLNESLDGGKPLSPATPGNQYFIKGTATLHRQMVSSEVLGRIQPNGGGNARVTVTAAGMNNSPKVFNVPVAAGDGAQPTAAKIRAALALDADVTALFTVGGEYQYVNLTKKAIGAHDATLNIAVANGTCAGLTAALNAVNIAPGAANPHAAGASAGIDVPIDFAAITPVEADAVNRPGGYIEADVRVDNLMYNGAAIPQQNASVKLEVYVLFTFVNGMARLAAPQANGIIIIPAARDFKVNPDGGQLNSIIHELGHCVGMVANVGEVQIDTHQYHYSHNGDHCSIGLARTAANDGPSYQIQANQDLAGLCVMFGFTSNVNPRTAFCAECEAVMKKIDSSGGLL